MKLKDPLLLTDSLDKLEGIGPRRLDAFKEYGLHTVLDLLQFLPRAYINRQKITPLSGLAEGQSVSVVGVVEKVRVIPRKRLTATLRDQTGAVDLVWFRGIEYVREKITGGARLNAWGKVALYNRTLQMAHPETRVLAEGEEPEKGIFPIYTHPEEMKNARMDSKVVQAAVRDALDRTRAHYPENLPARITVKREFPLLKEVYGGLHFPEDDAPERLHFLHSRLKYEEAFLICLKMEEIREQCGESGIAFKPGLSLSAKVCANLGFTVTGAQKRAIEEIEADLFSGKRMNRLLQGDVGSGKTAVCAVVIAHVLHSGYQAALMAPTEILARQHFQELNRLYRDTGKRIELFISGLPKAGREALDADLSSGRIDVAVGTHAIISESSVFAKLGLVIVDEQHRFGVFQRLSLKQKGAVPSMLVVSATPIPRTLALTLYGDLSFSVIDEMPPGRIPVKTYRVTERKREEMYGFIRGKIASGGRAFFILPLVEESEKQAEIKSATAMAETLQAGPFLEHKVGLLHGRMDSREKAAVMESFRNGSCRVLAATTVVEVGVDIPDADVMVIEHPERFGLAQLHQLRGRIGRGKRESFCFLLVGPSCSAEAYERLGKFAENHDGFKIAELDFEARGPGALTGLRQAGAPEFRFLHLVRDRGIVEQAKEDAQEIFRDFKKLPEEERNRLRKALKQYDSLSEKLLMTG